MMKRVLTVLIAVVFAMSLAACGNSVEENNTVTDGNGVTAAADGADAVAEAEPEGNTEGETAVPDESGEVPNVTIQDIVNKNYIADLVYNAGKRREYQSNLQANQQHRPRLFRRCRRAAKTHGRSVEAAFQSGGNAKILTPRSQERTGRCFAKNCAPLFRQCAVFFTS